MNLKIEKIENGDLQLTMDKKMVPLFYLLLEMVEGGSKEMLAEGSVKKQAGNNGELMLLALTAMAVGLSQQIKEKGFAIIETDSAPEFDIKRN